MSLHIIKNICHISIQLLSSKKNTIHIKDIYQTIPLYQQQLNLKHPSLFKAMMIVPSLIILFMIFLILISPISLLPIVK